MRKQNTKDYARKGYLNFFELPTKEEYKRMTHQQRLDKWKLLNLKKKER
jgi:hypothetical protein